MLEDLPKKTYLGVPGNRSSRVSWIMQGKQVLGEAAVSWFAREVLMVSIVPDAPHSLQVCVF